MSDKEQVALFDIRGTYTGAAKRTEAHAQGLRVGLVFIWAAWRDENALEHMLLQTRARPGDPYLGSLDAAAGGHIRAGETPRQAAEREFFEEVGIALQPDQLIDLGQLPLQYAQRGIVRHAMQFFYLCNRPIELGETVFSEEVSAFVHVRLDDFDAIVNGRAAQITGTVRQDTTPEETRQTAIAHTAFGAYSEPIMDAIRRSVRALRHALKHGVTDPAAWDPPMDHSAN